MSKKNKPEEKKLRGKFNLKSKPGQVIPYTEADKGLRKRMKKTIETVTGNPESNEAVRSYGSRAAAKLQRSTNRMLDLQKRLSKVTENFTAALGGQMDQFEIETLGRQSFDMLKALAGGDKSLMNPPVENKIAKLFQQELPALFGQVEALETIAKNADQQVTDMLDEIRRIDRQRRDATRELGIHIGASVKLTQKYGKDFLKDAAKKFAKSPKPKNKARLESIVRNGQDLSDRVGILTGMREGGLVFKSQLSAVTKAIKDQRKAVNQLLDTSKNEWRAMLSAAGATESSDAVQTFIRKADKNKRSGPQP